MDELLLALMPVLGFLAGTIGALIGAGGGFIAVPILLIVLPDETPGIITGMSQSMVLMTSLSSTVAYVRQKRIEYRWAAVMAITGLFGMAIGAYIVEQLERGAFQTVFGVAALILMTYLLIRPIRGRGAARTLEEAEEARIPLTRKRTIMLGIVGLATGTMGGLLGVGGGIAMVPIIVQAFVFPAHFATATSQLVILITSPAAIAVHIAESPLLEKDPADRPARHRGYRRRAGRRARLAQNLRAVDRPHPRHRPRHRRRAPHPQRPRITP